jgi:hypothetical protein
LGKRDILGDWVDRKYHSGKPGETEGTIEGGIIDETGTETTVEWALEPEPLTKKRLRYLMGLINRIEILAPSYDTAQNPIETVREWEVRISEAFLHFKQNERLQASERKKESARERQRRHRENEKRKADGELVPPPGTPSNAAIEHGPNCECDVCKPIWDFVELEHGYSKD